MHLVSFAISIQLFLECNVENMVLSDAKKSVSLLDENISFDLERLFDEYNMDHIPEEQRLDQFKQRDISYVKYYKSAVKIFGGPISRRRVIIAPPMETPTKHRIGFYMNKQQFPPNQILHNAVMPSGDVKLTSCEPQQSRLACLVRVFFVFDPYLTIFNAQ